MYRIYILLFLWTFLFCACSSGDQTDILFLKAESLLEESPDSALLLLSALPKSQKLSRKESAQYALLLARATDKCEKPLFLCDSLLNIALNYYDDDEKERAVALLYKGRMEQEINSTKEAIAHLQEGLMILKEFPKEIETKRHILSSLGNLYFDAKHYEEAIKTYRELYKCCMTDKDKSIALNNISSYYCVTNKIDSALVIQRKALEYAVASGDTSMIIHAEFTSSIIYDDTDELDSAIYHARNSIKWLSEEKTPSLYYGNLGTLLLEKGENIDSAAYYLNKHINDNTNLAEKATTLFSLYEIEKERGNYKAAITYLEQHTDILDSLYFAEQSTEVQRLINRFNIKTHIREEKIKEQRRLYLIIGCFVFCCLLIMLIYQSRINKRKRIQLIYQQALEKTKYKISTMQTIIEDNQSIISLLRDEYHNLEQEQKKKIKEIEYIIENNQSEINSLHEDHNILKQDQKKKIKEIQERELIINKLKQEKIELRNWLFAQSDIYKRIMILSNQEVTDKKELKVLTNTELKKLKKTIFEIYTDYISNLQNDYPKLTEEDILYLCLNEAKFKTQTIALCFGFNNTHPINQRKLRIKERMKNNKCEM